MRAARQVSESGEKRGIRYWMERVVVEAGRVRAGFEPDPVHDLRVALRRCRSMADGYRTIDAAGVWVKMRRAGKALFASLGELRDVQVLMEWVERLGAADDPARTRLLAHCRLREQELRTRAAAALADFDTRQWLKWSQTLGEKAGRLGGHHEVFLMLALEKWEDARRLQPRALRNGSAAGLHQLRIGIKRFRYVVENFLPEQHAAWGKDLKRLQDLLGEIHDLDVLADTAERTGAFHSPEEGERWRAAMARERAQRLDAYRQSMLGGESLWQMWRAELPRGDRLRRAALLKIELWAASLDPDVAHTRRVADFAAALYDALDAVRLVPRPLPPRIDPGEVLRIAALTHEVGRARDGKGHHRRSGRLVARLRTPPGWPPEKLAVAAVVARYHCGAMPSLRHKAYARLPREYRPLIGLLAGILRLADRFDQNHDGAIRRLQIEPRDGALAIAAQGYRAGTNEAEQIAAARHLLESAIRRPIVVTGARHRRTRARRAPARK